MKTKFIVGDIIVLNTGTITKEILEIRTRSDGTIIYVNKSSTNNLRNMENSQDYIEGDFKMLIPAKIRNTKLYKALK